MEPSISDQPPTADPVTLDELDPWDLTEVLSSVRSGIQREASAEVLQETFRKVERAKREWESSIDSLPELVCLADRAGRLLRANRTVEEWGLGQLRAIRGRSLHDLLHAGCADPECALDTFLQRALHATAQGQSSSSEFRDARLGRYIRVDLHPILDRERVVTPTAVVVVYDVTERKHIEEAEREQRALAEALRDSAAALNSTLELDEVLDRILANVGRVVAHDAASVMLVEAGVARVVRRHSTLDAVDPDLVLSLRFNVADVPSLRAMTESGQPLAISDTRVDQGWVDMLETKWIQSYAGAPIRLKGQVIGFLNLSSAAPDFFAAAHAERLQVFADQAAIAIENAQLYRDLRRDAEALEQRVIERTGELMRERERIETILEAAGEGIALTDRNWSIHYINPALEHLTGYNLADVFGRMLRLWDSQSTPPDVLEEMQRRIGAGEMWQGEVINRRRDGALYDAGLTITPLKAADGQILGYVSVQRDMTRLKELDRLKDRFIARVGHELRTPIANVKLYLELLERGKPERQAEYRVILHREANRLRRLVDSFIEMLLLESDAEPIALAPTNLHRIMVDLLNPHYPTALEQGLSIEYRPDPELPPALADSAAVSRAVSILLENALNYTPRGGKISVTTSTQVYADKDWVTLTVRDTGAGFLPEELPQLFARFFRGDAARDFTKPGVGLGLSICKTLVDKLGGRITVDNQPGQGAALTIWLKRAD
ncbi:MAG TPA: ATP-binding protein [Anaerolineae bacterium]|nr:ATP-binding protein [Anaerolineae bacterium]